MKLPPTLFSIFSLENEYFNENDGARRGENCVPIEEEFHFFASKNNGYFIANVIFENNEKFLIEILILLLFQN